LAKTFLEKVQDVLAHAFFPGTKLVVEYWEGFNVGYCYFDMTQKVVWYPFGYGLSYMAFQYSNLQI